MSDPDLSDLEEGSTAPRSRHDVSVDCSASFVAKVVTGPDSGASFSIDPSEPTPVLIGQSASCAIRLTDPEVSRRHARLDFVASRLRVVDLGSTNGTLVTGIAIGNELGATWRAGAAEGSARDGESNTISGDFIEQVLSESLPLPIARLRVVEEFARRYIARAVDQYGGNVARAAEASGIVRRYFQILRGGRRR